MHVSREILWVCPLIDLILFLLVALAVWLVSRFFKGLPAIRILVFLLVFLTAYDWLSLTGRLYPRACLLLSLGVAATFVRWLRTREPAACRFWRRSSPYLVLALLILIVGIQGGKRLHERSVENSFPVAPPGPPMCWWSWWTLCVPTIFPHTGTRGLPAR